MYYYFYNLNFKGINDFKQIKKGQQYKQRPWKAQLKNTKSFKFFNSFGENYNINVGMGHPVQEHEVLKDQPTVGKTVRKKKFWISFFLVPLKSLGFKWSYVTIYRDLLGLKIL